jgi:hypothetical protein
MIRIVAIILLLCCSVAEAQYQCGPNGCILPPQPGLQIGAGISIQPRPRAYPQLPQQVPSQPQWGRVSNPLNTPCVRVKGHLGNNTTALCNGVVLKDNASGATLIATVAHAALAVIRFEVVDSSRTHNATVVAENSRYDALILRVESDLKSAVFSDVTTPTPIGEWFGFVDPWRPVLYSGSGPLLKSDGLFPRYGFPSQKGMSGSGVFSPDRKLIGLISNGVEGGNFTDLVPSSVIADLVKEYAVSLKPTPDPPKMLVETPITPPITQPVNTCDCDCTEKFAAIESRIETLSEAMKAQQDAGEGGTEAAAQITALNEQIIILRTELDSLKLTPGPPGPVGPPGKPGPSRTVTVILTDEQGKQLTGPIEVPPGASRVKIPVVRFER